MGTIGKYEGQLRKITATMNEKTDRSFDEKAVGETLTQQCIPEEYYAIFDM